MKTSKKETMDLWLRRLESIEMQYNMEVSTAIGKRTDYYLSEISRLEFMQGISNNPVYAEEYNDITLKFRKFAVALTFDPKVVKLHEAAIKRENQPLENSEEI